ncbi:MAG: cytochrome P450 [Pseudomonadota bacterium]
MTTAAQPHSIFGPDFVRDPYAVYRQWRAEGAVMWDAGAQAFVVTGAEAVSTVLKDSATFSSDRVTSARTRFADPALKPLFDLLSYLLLQRDEPDHTRLRALVHTAFKKTAVEHYVDDIAALAKTLLADADKGPFDFVSGFAVPLPILVISQIVGIPPADRDQVKAWCDAFSVVALNFYAQISDEELYRGLRAVEAFSAYLLDRARTLEANPDGSLLSALVAARHEGHALSEEELVANTLLLLNAGNETTTNLLANGLHVLLDHPDTMAALRAEPQHIPAAVEEMLRHDAPVQFIGRVAVRDTTLGGKAIKTGDLVLVFLGSAGRDGARFDRPDDFIAERHPNPHVAFGAGPHVCAGLQLARVEANVAFSTLLSEFAVVERAPGEIGVTPNKNLRCVAHLPVTLRRTERASVD